MIQRLCETFESARFHRAGHHLALELYQLFSGSFGFQDHWQELFFDQRSRGIGLTGFCQPIEFLVNLRNLFVIGLQFLNAAAPLRGFH